MAVQQILGFGLIVESPSERLVFFECGATTLAGILTVPEEPNGRAILIAWGSGAFPSSGPNRIRTTLARTLAHRGFHAFRFDYRGVGESDGDYRQPHMAKPNTEEIIAACTWLTSHGLPHVVVVANCFGGWSALLAASMLPGLEGMAVVNVPVRRDHKEVRDTLQWRVSKLKKFRPKKLLSAKHREAYRKLLFANASKLLRLRSAPKRAPFSPSGSHQSDFSAAVRYLVGRRIPLLLLYSNGDFWPDFKAEMDRGLAGTLALAGPPTRVINVAERLEGFASLQAQDALLREVLPWLMELPEFLPTTR